MEKSTRSTFERLISLAALDYFAMNFPSPDLLSPVVGAPGPGVDAARAKAPDADSTGEGAAAVRLFADDGNCQFACVDRYSTISEHCRREDENSILLNPSDLIGRPDYLLGMIGAHELYHTVQLAIPGSERSVPESLSDYKYFDCEEFRSNSLRAIPPKWIIEAQATAAANVHVRAWHSNFYPPDPGEPFVRYFVGLRPYNLPLNHKFGAVDHINDPTGYATSSFWMHLTDIYHGGTPQFHEYLREPEPGKDWLKWLDAALQTDPAIKTPLYLVYPGFLTHFAGQFEGSGVGRKYGMTGWLMEGFGLCWEAVLSPDDPFVTIKIKNLEPMTGQCLMVTIKGLNDGQTSTVKVGAVAKGVTTEDRELVDSLHLGFVRTDDRTNFNCSLLSRSVTLPPGMAECLLEPVTGVIGQITPAKSTVKGDLLLHTRRIDPRQAARNWFATGPHRSRPDQKAGITNLYILSRVPREPSSFRGRATKKKTKKKANGFTLEVGLDSANLSVITEDGGREYRETRRTVTAMGNKSLETDMLTPPSTGWIDSQGMGTILGDEVLALMSEGRNMAQRLPEVPGVSGEFGGKSILRFAEAEITRLGDPMGEISIAPQRQFSVLDFETVPPGTTGSFPVRMSGAAPDAGIMYLTLDKGDATLTILENSETVFRAKVTGVLCAIAASDLGSGADCPGKVRVEAEISKPFAYLYRPETQLIAVETKGEKLYNEFGPPRLMREMLGGGGGAGIGGGAAGSGAGAVAAGTADCTCNCPDSAVPDSPECRTECQPQWAICQRAATAPEPAPAPRPPKPTVEAQVTYLRRLIGDQGLAPEVEEMLVEDFAAMSDETRAYLLRRYRDGVE